MDWKNRLYFGDNLEILRREVPDASVDLIYLDPPFNSNATYNVLFREKSGEESTAQIMAFSGVTQYLEEVRRALRAVDGSLGQVKIDNVTDPQDVQRPLAQVEEIVDRALAPYMGNPTVRALATQMKTSYKEQMLRQVEAKRREVSGSRLSSEG